MGVLRLQFLTTYLSDQVIAGFTVGSSVHVLVSQLKTLLGIRGLPRHSGPFYLFRQLYDLILAIPRANLVCCGISLVSIVVLHIGKEFINPFIKKKTNSNIPIPWELVIVIATTVFVAVTGVDVSNKVQIVNKIPVGVPDFAIPSFSLIPQVLPDAISITIVGVSVWLSISKMLAKKMSYELDSGQELFALSFSCIGSSFIPVVPISCSLSRTLVAVGAGCTTQLSILFSSILVFSVVFYLGILLETLPMAALSAIICVALQGMFRKFSDLGDLWKVSKIDFVSFQKPSLKSSEVPDNLGGLLRLHSSSRRLHWPHHLCRFRPIHNDSKGTIVSLKHQSSLEKHLLSVQNGTFLPL